MRKPIIGVMGGAHVSQEVYHMAIHLGELIAEKGWSLLNGGRDAGVMRASAEGAKRKGGTTIGILPGDDAAESNPFIDIPIVTNMGDARNVINVLSSDVVAACPGSAGTISEIALALKNHKHVILLGWSLETLFEEERSTGQLLEAKTPAECVALIAELLKKN
jgi:uncharacterized protein (TIGR00725 family)